MISDKELTLNNVFHVRKNGFKMGFVYDKFVLSKNEMYIGKSYLSGLLKLNVLTVILKNIINKISTFAYIVESFVWYDKL